MYFLFLLVISVISELKKKKTLVCEKGPYSSQAQYLETEVAIKHVGKR